MIRKYTKVILSCLFIVLQHAPLHAQQRLTFSHILTEDGLSQSSIWAIGQDYQGFMWFGTFDGLNRYDGYSFKVYKNDPSDLTSINSNAIETIVEDKDKNLWIGTSEGLNLYDRAKDEFIKFKDNQRNPSRGTSIQTIFEGKDGTKWIGGAQGISYVDRSTGKLRRFTPGYSSEENKSEVNAIVEDDDENLWVATGFGIDHYNKRKNKFTRYAIGNNTASNFVEALLVDASKTVWAATRDGIFSYNAETDNFIPSLITIKGEVHAFLQRADGTIVIATNNGAYVYDKLGNNLMHYLKGRSVSSICDNSVTSLYEDRTKNLWLGTFNGLNYTGNAPKFATINAETPGIHLKNSYILSLVKDNENKLWVGTGKGIEVLDISLNNIKKTTDNHPALSTIATAILSMSAVDDNIWITTWPLETFVYNKTQKALKNVTSIVPNCGLVVADHPAKIWFACEKGLRFYNPNENAFGSIERLNDIQVTYIYKDKPNGLWLGYGLGLIHYDLVTDRATFFRDHAREKSNLNVSSINNVYKDKNGVLWLATDLGLRARINGNFESFWKQHGFPDHTVKSILEDDHNNLWLATNDGIYKFNKETHNVIHFDTFDGLQGREFSRNTAVKMNDGKLVFGGTKGLNIFFPDSIQSQATLPTVVFTEFKILNRKVPLGTKSLKKHVSVVDQINLQHTDKEFSFEFVGVNFSAPEKTQYAYKMEGYDKEWNYSGTRRFASYTNLPTGNLYTFKVKASNRYGIWNEQAASVNVYIHPPFWDTWWFKTIVYLLTAGLAYLGYRLKVNSVRRQRIQLVKKKKILEQEVKVRTAQLQEANEKLQMQALTLKEQAEEITVINEMLTQDNLKLEHNVKDLEQARVLQKWVSFEEFQKLYPDNESCYKFIEEQKWGKGYQCRKCGNQKYSPGHIEFSRRCSKCNYIETITTATIFEGVKFPITKAFHLLFLISEGKRYTLKELANHVDLRPQTCWTFKKRVEERTKHKNIQKNKDGLSHLILLS